MNKILTFIGNPCLQCIKATITSMFSLEEENETATVMKAEKSTHKIPAMAKRTAKTAAKTA